MRPWGFVYVRLLFESAENFVDLRKACKGTRVALNDFHHFAHLLFTDDTYQHVFFGVGVHTRNTDFRNAVAELFNQFRRQFLGFISDNFKFVPVFQTSQSGIHHDVGNEEV